jgi:hypothetical protein
MTLKNRQKGHLHGGLFLFAASIRQRIPAAAIPPAIHAGMSRTTSVKLPELIS